MKFIAGLRVWGNWEIGENVLKVFLRLRGSANRRVDLFLPLIASISGWRQCDASKCEMRRLGRVTPSAGRDVIDRKACFLSLLAQAAVWLPEHRVSRTFLDILRLICSVHGYPARRAASTADPDDPPRSWSTNYVVSSPAGQEATREPELAGFAWIAVLSWSGQSPIHVVESRRLLPLLGIESEPEVPARWPRPMPRNLDVNPRRSWLPRPRRWRTKRRSATF